MFWLAVPEGWSPLWWQGFSFSGMEKRHDRKKLVDLYIPTQEPRKNNKILKPTSTERLPPP